MSSNDKHPEKLHIFVNRRRFEETNGVRPTMTGAAIAALVDVPADIAVVRLENGNDRRDIGIADPIVITNGMHFLVTRKVVEGGHAPRAH